MPADRDGAFVDAAGAGFAAVRSGELWFAVNGRPLQPDLRYDAGLVALKRREADGSWRDLIRPRPMTVGRPPSSAGPVLVAGGREWFPYARGLAVGRRGVVTMRAGFTDAPGPISAARSSSATRPSPAACGSPSRCAPATRCGFARSSPRRSARRARGGRVRDADAVATLRPRPDRVAFQRGFASCCDARLVAGDDAAHA